MKQKYKMYIRPHKYPWKDRRARTLVVCNYKDQRILDFEVINSSGCIVRHYFKELIEVEGESGCVSIGT